MLGSDAVGERQVVEATEDRLDSITDGWSVRESRDG